MRFVDSPTTDWLSCPYNGCHGRYAPGEAECRWCGRTVADALPLPAVTVAVETLKAAYPEVKAERHTVPTAKTDRGLELHRVAHLLWMCDEIQAFLSLGQREKAMRWLGFVQGSLWTMGLRTIDEMRGDNAAPV